MIGKISLMGAGHFIWLAFLLTISACGGQGIKPQPSKAESIGAESRSESVPFKRQAVIQRLLSEADEAYSRGRFTLPDNDNAYDRYRAVLLLEANNAQAQAGLDAVLLAYVDHVRSVMAGGHLSAAEQLVDRGRAYFTDQKLLEQLNEEIKQARALSVSAREEKDRTEVLDGEKILLPEGPLSQRSDPVVELLQELAVRVSESNESVMIFARNDSEGRWVYKVMKDKVVDYRIRGDIRISRVPAIVLLPPL